LPPDPIEIFRRAHAIDALGQRAAALDALAAGLLHHPGHPALVALRANILLELGDADAARPELERLAAGPGATPEFWSSLASAANAGASADARRVFEFHRGYGTSLEAARPGGTDTPARTRAPGEPLRVGIVSYDFKRRSSVSFFLRPILEHLDREAFEVTAYHVGRPADDATERFRTLVHRFRHLPEPSPDALAAAIRADGIDLALELIGHTGRRSLPAFQPRCAPVQVSYLGYSNTTGMRSFDWRIVDSITDPPGEADALATERLYRLDPCFLCFAPDPETPEVSPAPCLSRGHVTFGSFNSVLKLSSPTLRLWARVLDAVPGSRLILKNRAPRVRGGVEHLRGRLLEAGLDLSRVEIRPMTPGYREHLDAYAEVDIALDTFPYNGTTTTCEALLMGVPVLTLRPPPEHDRHAARVGMSILNATGNQSSIASNEADFVNAAARLASTPGLLTGLRAEGRRKLLASPLCDPTAFARRFGRALQEIAAG
jgi:predicted O-linked N-acetylglucosamine transferase (SPINDLY family)